MPHIGIIIGIAVIAFIQTAVVFGGIYFSVGRLFPHAKRAVVSSIGSASVFAAYFAMQLFEDGIAPLFDILILTVVLVWIGALALLTWRTHMADQRKRTIHQS